MREAKPKPAPGKRRAMGPASMDDHSTQEPSWVERGRHRSDRPPPETWEPARRAVLALVRPLESFLKIQASSGILLMIAAVVAMAWANSPWSESYHHLWHTPIQVGFGDYRFQQSLHFVINDVLMVVFFFVVGLEIRREMHEGELSELKRAALPVAAAIGGMLVPAAIYAAFNYGSPTSHGWGVPMATDIAFAVGVLALLGPRVPAALRVLLLALAIIDDIGAILVIALFYSSGVEWTGLVVAAVGWLGVIVLQRVGTRRPVIYVVPGFVVWVGILAAGVHPTIAGVIIGLLTPARPWFGEEGFLVRARDAIEDFESHAKSPHANSHHLLEPLSRLDEARREAVAPVVRLESALNPWVAYGIMPLFALANAGVTVTAVDVSGAASASIAFGVALGLILGKPLGIVLVSMLAVRLGLCALPRGVDAKGFVVVGCVAGIGFTMALFIAQLAFRNPLYLSVAKISVLVGSLIAGVLGLVVGLVLLKSRATVGVALSADDAERSTDL